MRKRFSLKKINTSQQTYLYTYIGIGSITWTVLTSRMTERIDVVKNMKENLKECQSVTHIKRRKKHNHFKREQSSNINKKTGTKKLNVKQKALKKIAKKSSPKVTKKFNTPKIVLRKAKKTYNSQIHNTIDILNQPLNEMTLTPDELKMLFTKYKVDGHYRTSGNPLPFSALSNNKYDSVDKNTPCNTTNQYKYVNEISENTWQSNMIEPTNMHYNANTENRYPEENRNVQQGLRYESWKDNREVLRPINMNVNGDNKHSYYEQNSPIDSNCRHMFVSCDTQTYCDSYVSSNIENLEQASKFNNIANKKGCQNNVYNATVNSYSNIHESGFHINKWNSNSMSITENSNLPYNASDIQTQPWNGIASTELETYHDNPYNINNSMVYQPTNVLLDKNFSEDRSSFNRYIDTSMYSTMVVDENLKYTCNSNDSNVQQEFSSFPYGNSTYPLNSPSITSDTTNSIIETNAFATYSVNMTGQYI